MCPHEEKLTAWLLGDLPPEEHEALTRHLEDCASCRGVRDELARVLAPLRSGLEKDRNLNIEPLPEPMAPPRPPSPFWSAPHEGLRRVAVLALTCGTLFAVIGVLYHSSQRPAAAPDSVTYVSYLQPNEAPAPALAPAPEQPRADPAKDLLDVASSPAAPAAEPPAATAAHAIPAPVRQAPALPRLADADRARLAVSKAFPAPRTAPVLTEAAPDAGAYAAAPAKASKRERAKQEAVRKPDASLYAKPLALAGAAAPTNALPTNAVPTNAVAPANVKSQP